MENKINPGVEKNDPNEPIDMGTQSGKKKRGLIARFLAWIAKGAEQASKDGSFCGR